MNDDLNADRPAGYGDRGRWFEDARSSVRSPGTVLQWFGLISLVLSLAGLAVVLIKPELAFKWLWEMQVEINKKQPPEQRQPIPRLEEFVEQQATQNTISGIVQMFASLVIMYGGMQVKEMRGYGWGIASSVLSILPCNFCCCIGAPIGAWALVVLLGSDVRLAFARARAMEVADQQPPDSSTNY